MASRPLRVRAQARGARANNNLSLSPDAAVPSAPIGNVPMSPTDANLSPCSKQLWGKRRPSYPDLKAKAQPRQWESVVEASESEDDEDAAASSSGDEGGNGLAGSSEDVEVVSGDGSGAFFTSHTELNVAPRPPPCRLPIILGSASSNRRTVMQRLGWNVALLSADIDEKAIRRADPREMCLDIARAKAGALLDRAQKPAILVTADQVVVFDGNVREKPSSTAEAKAFLRSYSDRTVTTLSAVVVTNTENGRQAGDVHAASVTWATISEEVVESVVARGLVLRSAGGFLLEDPELAPLAKRVDGSVDSVWGLPVEMMCYLIKSVV